MIIKLLIQGTTVESDAGTSVRRQPREQSNINTRAVASFRQDIISTLIRREKRGFTNG
jgi:hypothetical protein